MLAGATPGIHFPDSRYYIRRMRLGIGSNLVPALENLLGNDGKVCPVVRVALLVLFNEVIRANLKVDGQAVTDAEVFEPLIQAIEKL